MAGTSKKRTADAEETGPSTRASKAAKTDSSDSPAKTKAAPKPKKEKAKAPSVSAETFSAKALPLHFNLTHTPPSIADADTVPSASADPGHIGSLSMLPTTFNTGSFGWKANSKFTIELQNDQGEKETVQVVVGINATVAGSKPSKAKKAAPSKAKKAAAAESDGEEEGSDE